MAITCANCLFCKAPVPCEMRGRDVIVQVFCDALCAQAWGICYALAAGLEIDR